MGPEADLYPMGSKRGNLHGPKMASVDKQGDARQ